MGLFNDPSLYALATFVIIISCGLAVLLGYAVHRLHYGLEEETMREPSAEQAAYMHEVRLRNLRDVAAMFTRNAFDIRH